MRISPITLMHAEASLNPSRSSCQADGIQTCYYIDYESALQKGVLDRLEDLRDWQKKAAGAGWEDTKVYSCRCGSWTILQATDTSAADAEPDGFHCRKCRMVLEDTSSPAPCDFTPACAADMEFFSRLAIQAAKAPLPATAKEGSSSSPVTAGTH